MKKSILICLSLFLIYGISLAQDLSIDLNTEALKSEPIEEHVSFIDLIKNGESYTILIESMGCFGGSTSSMIISKTNDKYFVQMNEKKIELTGSDISDFRGFEQELVQIGKGYCTSSDSYTLSYGNERIKVTDSTCSWNGYYRLKKKFDLG